MPHSIPLPRPVLSRLAFPALLLGNVVLALGPIFVRFADTGPISAGFWRLFLAAPILFLLARRANPALTPRGMGMAGLWGLLLLAGFCFAADLASWHGGILRTKLANATLFGNVTSLLLPLWGILILRHPVTRLQGFALLLAAAGTALLMGASYELSPRYLVGDLLCILAGFFYFGYVLAVQHLRQRLDSATVLASATIIGTPFLLVAALVAGEPVIPTIWWPIILLSLSSQIVGQGLVVYAMPAFSPMVVGLMLLVQPVAAAIVGRLLFGEVLTIADFGGAAAIAAALVLIRWPTRD